MLHRHVAYLCSTKTQGVVGNMKITTGTQAFTNKDIQDITGVYGRNIINYAEKGIIVPNIQENSGVGSTRLWDMANLIEFATLKALQNTCMSLKLIEQCINWLNNNDFSQKLAESIAYMFIRNRHEWDVVQADEAYIEEEYDNGIDYELFPRRVNSNVDTARKRMFPKFIEPIYSKMYSPYSKCLFNLYQFYEIIASSEILETEKENLVSMIEPFVGFFAYDVRNIELTPDEREEYFARHDENRYETETFEKANRKLCLIMEIIDGKEFRFVDEPEIKKWNELDFHTVIRLNLSSIAVDCYSKLMSMRSTEYFVNIFSPKLISEMNKYKTMKGGVSNGIEG